MLTICTLISTLTTKHRVCVKGASKQSPKPQEFYRAGTAPPVLKFLDPPLSIGKILLGSVILVFLYISPRKYLKSKQRHKEYFSIWYNTIEDIDFFRGVTIADTLYNQCYL